VLVVVTRYYGGTKLGTGGLARAYGTAARTALDACATTEKRVTLDFILDFDYNDLGLVHHAVNGHDGTVISTDYAERIDMRVAIPRSRAAQFSVSFEESLAGRGRCLKARTPSGG
jgi:putative IMPACT (imprinted ancient) family translation regulator